MTSSMKVFTQQFGRFLSAMVMPNIGAIIAWGLITTLFIPVGWFPNPEFSKLVVPMIHYLLPLLFGYMGGKLAGGERGAVVGAVATMGAIVSSEAVHMLLGGMIAGTLGGYVTKKFDQAIEGKIKPGFEMLVNNFSAGIIGMILAILTYLVIGPSVVKLSAILGAGVGVLVSNGLLPLVSLLVEPAKILFLNNAINQGVFTPLGIAAAAEHGKTFFFLLEANPGPGLGLLLAYMFFGRGEAKGSAPTATIIHFFGGIHEIYFPYVLMKPRLILAMIAGGMTGVFVLTLFGAGLRAPAAPGSIFAVLMMCPKESLVGVLASVISAAAVSFLVASFLLKMEKTEEGDSDLEDAARRVRDMKLESKGQTKGQAATTPASAPSVATTITEGSAGKVRSIIVACDAGMGSSAMGASMLRRKLEQAGLSHISSTNTSIDNLPDGVDLVITHRDLTERAKRVRPNAIHMSIGSFMDQAFYDDLIGSLRKAKAT